MPSRLLVTSPSNLKMLSKMKNNIFRDYDVHIVRGHPRKKDFDYFDGDVVALGGGSVIDTAKMIANPKKCYVIPTNASGACSTSHAVYWFHRTKRDVATPIPIVLNLYKILPIKLSKKDTLRTLTDCYCHIFESRTSKNSTVLSESYCDIADAFLLTHKKTGSMKSLINAGIWAGKAIEITGTNIIHAISYIFTEKFGLCHGDALMEALKIKSHNRRKYIIDIAVRKYGKKLFTSKLVSEDNPYAIFS